ncbi:MAG: hypothetical protein HQL57_07945, partial [Magnetococcales bacterium]|nr:hypothetical protein [Magnetococcales bacterium]
MPSIEALRSIAQDEFLTTQEAFAGVRILSGTPAPKGGVGYYTAVIGSGEEGLSDEVHPLIPVHRVAQRDILSFIVAHSLVPRDLEGVTERLNELYALTVALNRQTPRPQAPSLRAIERHFLEADYLRARLPVLEGAYLHDMEKGLWELFQPAPPKEAGWVEVELETPWEARDPSLDVREGAVAIDFGTSSTVVACREEGQTTLLRVGMNDLFKKPTPEDYQNPTILAFIHLPNLLTAWNSEAYRPLTNWDDFHFSHEALALLRENEADQRIVASLMTNLKQWPLISLTEPNPRRLTDQQTGTELEIRHPDNPMPVPGQPLTLAGDELFDPLELYAYYLGLFINHRANGIFLDYFMTFPVTYPREVKGRILASFARGLQRSLPLALLASPVASRFSVREEASEPAAYAACALHELDIPATPQGTAFAVFDFGGGTTDYDFGIFRLPTQEEKEQGYETVIHHFGASGDMFLGGENLVANLAFLVFKQNLELLREHRIPFNRPPEGDRFPGHELFIDSSHVAETNSTMLMAKVRPIWEEFFWKTDDSPGGRPLPTEDPPLDLPAKGGETKGETKSEKKNRESASGKGKAPRRRHSDWISDEICRHVTDAEFTLDPQLTISPPGENPRLEIPLELLNRNREKVTVTLVVDRNRINHYLVKRVGQGIHRFFIAMRQAFLAQGLGPETIHILQAGNASRAVLVQALFAALLREKMAQWPPPPVAVEESPAMASIRQAVAFPHFIVHRPPVGDPANPYRPNAKTGVAIGLLRLIPGETVLTLGPDGTNTAGEAPFRFFVGLLRQGAFQPVIPQNGPYQQWHALGIPTRGAFNLIYSASPQAALGTLKRGAMELRERTLSFPQGMEGKRLFIQAIAPSRVEVALADSLERLKDCPEEITFRESLDLKL